MFGRDQVLGDTLDKIAWEKGGIFKEGCKAFTVEQPRGGMSVLREVEVLQCFVSQAKPEVALLLALMMDVLGTSRHLALGRNSSAPRILRPTFGDRLKHFLGRFEPQQISACR